MSLIVFVMMFGGVVVGAAAEQERERERDGR